MTRLRVEDSEGDAERVRSQRVDADLIRTHNNQQGSGLRRDTVHAMEKLTGEFVQLKCSRVIRGRACSRSIESGALTSRDRRTEAIT